MHNKNRYNLMAFIERLNARLAEKDAAIITPPTLAEAKRIEAAAGPNLKRAIILSHYTGLRPGSVELLPPKWSRVDFEAKTIQIISAHKGGPMERLMPLHDEVVAKLKTWRERDIAHEIQKTKRSGANAAESNWIGSFTTTATRSKRYILPGPAR